MSTFNMALSSFIIAGTTFSSAPVSGWFAIFTFEHFFTFLLLSLLCGAGLFISYMYVGKFFEPIVSASVLLFEPILATILIFIFKIEMLPGPFACLGKFIISYN
jgi:hypothetical protein